MRRGYSCIWKSGKDPYLEDKDGNKVDLVVENYVPYLLDGDIALPASSSTDPMPPAPAEGGPEPIHPDADGVGPAPVPMHEEDAGLVPAEDEKKGPRDLKAEAKLLKHLMTDMPKNPYCQACFCAPRCREPLLDAKGVLVIPKLSL
jgi:hypothetical protein